VIFMMLNAGCGGGDYAFNDLGCEVNCDIQKLLIKSKNFVQCDVRYLPFRDKTFRKVYAYNLLEHIKDYHRALNELCRVANGKVLIRFDKIYNLANWWTLDHVYIQHGKHLIPAPKMLKILRFIFRFPTVHNRLFRRLFCRSFPALRKIGLLDRWNYYFVRTTRG